MNGPRAEGMPQGILFVDVADSTTLYRSYGDVPGDQVLTRCLDALRQVIEAEAGEVNLQIGDELLCAFETPEATARAAVQLQRAVQRAKANGELPVELNVRVGFHYGPVGIDGDRLFGDTVHTAKRMVEMAKPQQVVTTNVVASALGDREEFPARRLESIRLKGHSDPVEVVELVWDPKAATDADLAEQAARARKEERVSLTYRGTTIVVGSARPRIRIGRDPHCDLVVDTPQVSRFHADVELRRTGIILIDASTNGTQVHERGAAPRVLNREEHRLAGEGRLILGSASLVSEGDSEDAPAAIAYRCISPRTLDHGSG